MNQKYQLLMRITKSTYLNIEEGRETPRKELRKEVTTVDITPLHDMLTAEEIFNIEHILNEKMPHLRVHIELNHVIEQEN